MDSDKKIVSEHSLNRELQESIEQSRLPEITKLFALVASSDGLITEAEKSYVYDFYINNYPEELTDYLYNQFLQYGSGKIRLDDIHLLQDNKLPYGERLFLVMKLFEMILTGGRSESEIKISKEIASRFNIRPADLKVIIGIYGIEKVVAEESDGQSSIVRLTISDDPATCDVYLPYRKLNIEVFKTEKFFWLIQKDKSNTVTVTRDQIRQNFATKLPYGNYIQINKSFIYFEHLKFYFQNKINRHPDKIFYLNQKADEISLEPVKGDHCLMNIVLKGSLIEMEPASREIDVRVNRKKINGVVYVNINDFIQVNRSILNIRKLIFQEYFEKEFIHILPGKDTYVIANYGGDIYISDKMETKWEGSITRKKDRFYVDPGDCPHPFWIIRNEVENEINRHRYHFWRRKHKPREILHDDILYVKGGYALKCDFKNLVLEKTNFSFKNLIVHDLEYRFEDGAKAIEKMSFDVDHGDLICVMGPSGCGKTTLINILNGNLRNNSGSIYLDNFPFNRYYEKIRRYMSYVPQEDLLFENLTVYENLYYNARLRYPNLSKEHIDTQVERVLKDTGLYPKKNSKVGSVHAKLLSGGERKRLNIGLGLLADANIYFLDEPTSGLSSKDSEKIIDLLKQEALKGKIIFVVIHQPGSKIYKKFSKLILLDQGGKLAFFGHIYTALRYFRKSSTPDSDLAEIECPACKRVEPDFLLDSMEEPLRDYDGTKLPRRKFSPLHWQRQFEGFRKSLNRIKIPTKNILHDVPSKNLRRSERIKQLIYIFQRNFLNKFRDRSNLLVTFMEAPLLGLIIGFILRYSPDSSDTYNLYNNIHLSTYLFLTVIVTIFFAMSNSVDEIIKDNAVRFREKMINISNLRYFVAKYSTLLIFSALQNLLFLTASFWVLEIKELFLAYWGFSILISMTGISFGLMISSIPNITSKAAQNFVPLILIPQIIFGGALIKYRDMNKSLTIYKNSPIPEVSQLMASRWSYEGLMLLQDSFGRYHAKKDSLQNRLERMVNAEDSLQSAWGATEYQHRKSRIMDQELVIMRRLYQNDYGNREIHDAVQDSQDKLQTLIHPEDSTGQVLTVNEDKVYYPLFVSRKKIPGINRHLPTVIYNGFMLLVFSLVLNGVAIFMLTFRDGLTYIVKKIFRRKIIR